MDSPRRASGSSTTQTKKKKRSKSKSKSRPKSKSRSKPRRRVKKNQIVISSADDGSGTTTQTIPTTATPAQVSTAEQSGQPTPVIPQDSATPGTPPEPEKKDEKKKNPHKWRNRFIFMTLFILIGVVIVLAVGGGNNTDEDGGDSGGSNTSVSCNSISNQTKCRNRVGCIYFDGNCIKEACENYSGDETFCNGEIECMYFNGKCSDRNCESVDKDAPCNNAKLCSWDGEKCVDVSNKIPVHVYIGIILIILGILFAIWSFYKYRKGSPSGLPAGYDPNTGQVQLTQSQFASQIPIPDGNSPLPPPPAPPVDPAQIPLPSDPNDPFINNPNPPQSFF